MSVSQSAQDQAAQSKIEQQDAVQVQMQVAGSERLTELLAKVPQLSALAATFFAAGSILADTLTMGGNKHV